ncbi:MAG TPA: BPSS1780 family membrane protein [Nitrosomonas sp.]|nr:BPSS1780 family membrane protein [Nitrosomonas sp.]
MEIRQVSAKHGWHWIANGFHMFRKAPMIWVLVCFTLLLIAMTLALIPILGQFVFTLVSPVFLAGIMIGCREQDQGKQLEIVHLFVAFKTNVAPLVTVGGIYLIGQVLIIGLVMMIGGSQMTDMLLYGKRVDENELMIVMDNMLTASLVALLFSIPLMMAAWFSPLLVVFHNLQPIPAMKKSFFACLKNIIPFQLYGILLITFTILAFMPYGAGLVILIPTIFASIYVSYKDIFLGEETNITDDYQPETNYQKATWSNKADEPEPAQKEEQREKSKRSNTYNENSPLAAEGDIVACDVCKILIPKEEAIRFNGRFFCSDEHFQQYQENMDADIKK